MFNFFFNITNNVEVSILCTITFYLLLLFDCAVFLVNRRSKNLNFVIASAIAFAAGLISGVLGYTGAAAISVCAAIGYLGASLIYGGMALSYVNANKNKGGIGNFGDLSSTYSTGVLQTQTNQNLPVPLLYGTVKLAGNRIWQDDKSNNPIKRIVAFAEGEIVEFSDIRLNDIESSKISGIKINKYYGLQEQEVDEIVGGSTQKERIEKVGSLKNIAYLAVTVPRSEKIDINYNLTAVVKGRKIRVYTAAKVYEIKYSENPVWVMFDFLTCYNGLGLGLNNDGTVNEDLINELFDIESFIESAAYCDQIVETNGEQTPRFTFNMIFDAQTSARSLIDEIYRSCRGGLFLKDGKLQFKIDKAEPVSRYIAGEYIVKGSETFQTMPSEEHYDILKCSYVSPKHEWQKVEAFAEIPEYKDGVPVEHSVNIYSVTDFHQASRLAWYYVNSKRLCPYFGSFQTDYRAYDLEVGDVIQFDSLLMGLTKYKVKITSVANDGAGTYTINWRNYDERLYNDTPGSKEPRVLVSKLADIAAYPENVKNFNVVQSQNILNFVWSPNEDVTNTYEIRTGDSWENGIVIGKNISENNYSCEITTTGLFKFWIKSFTGYNYSKDASLDVISIDSIPMINEIVKYDLLENHNGEFQNTYFYHNTIKLKTSPDIKWITTENFWGDDDYYKHNNLWGAEVYNEGSFISQVYDLGDILDVLVFPEFKYKSSGELNSAAVYWRYSDDNETWSDWNIINKGQAKFRYSQYKAELKSIDNAQVILFNFKISVDVPDKEMALDVQIMDAENGLVVNYDFINIPSIVATVNDDITAYAVVEGETKNNKQCIIKAYKNDGTPVCANVNMRIKGY